MNRLALFGLLIASVAAGAAAQAQQTAKMPRIGLLTPNPPHLAGQHFAPFAEALRELGYEEGRNVLIERRYASGRPEDFPALVADLLSNAVDVIVAAGPHAIRASQEATTKVPIVMAISHEPVAMGFVKSLPRPGGNTTGLAFQDSELSSKRLEQLRAALPGVKKVGTLWDRSGAGTGGLRALQEAAGVLRLQLHVTETNDADDLPQAFASLKAADVGAVFQIASPLFSAHRVVVSQLALRHRLPMSCETPALVEAGCLMAYGPSFPDMWRRAATYVDRILRGAAPADLPVEQASKFELVLNLKTARALGLTIPPSLLLQADRIIE
ncbi:MAG: transporter substrate-binding protein [Burkholderiales bacterium]|nr:transporter substrate-binding protein [Burkholderiales bacterium]